MPDIFVETGHGITGLVTDATEFKFQNASNFELNSLMFSHYKNTQTGKALIEYHHMAVENYSVIYIYMCRLNIRL